jgi:surface protein
LRKRYQSIGDWDVSAVTTMQNMFYRNTAFNQPIGDWDVSVVTTMSGMLELSAFNQPIGDWDVCVEHEFGGGRHSPEETRCRPQGHCARAAP